MPECKYIERSSIPNSTSNRPISYKDLGETEDYVYYEHDDGFGKKSLVQFCKLIGRKKDVFECLNEGEWKACLHYKIATEVEDE